MPEITTTSLLREIEAKNERIKKLETALHNSTDLLKIGAATIENLYDRNYAQSQIKYNNNLLGISND